MDALSKTMDALSKTMDALSKKQRGWSWWYLLLLIQFAAVLWTPFYNKVEPDWIGIPFFYWYQLLWIIHRCRAYRDRVFCDSRLKCRNKSRQRASKWGRNENGAGRQ